MRGFRGKWLLRKALRDLLPHNILYRQKRASASRTRAGCAASCARCCTTRCCRARVYERGQL